MNACSITLNHADCVLFSPHQRAGQRVAACLTAHCAYLHHLPWLLDVGGGEGLQQGREDPSGNLGRAGREERRTKKGREAECMRADDTGDHISVSIII